MKSIPLNIKENSDIKFFEQKENDYSYAFRKLYVSSDKINDKKFGNYLQKKYNLPDIEYRSLQSDVASKIAQTKTNKLNQEERIIDIANDLKGLLKGNKSNKNTRSKFKKHNIIKQLDDSLPRNITFGGKSTLRDLTKLYNNIPVIKKEKVISERKKMLAENKDKIKEKTKLWKKNRILPFYILGESNQEGNRFFDFNFAEKTITYKPFKGKKIELKYSCNNNYQKELIVLQELINNKSISTTLTIRKNKICISFDDEILSGYCINKQERKKEVAEINKKNLEQLEKKELIKEIYLKYYEDLKAKKLERKISNRFIAIDMNPDYIGYCIADKGVDGIKKIIEKGVINFKELHEKLNLPSDHALVKRQNNKCKFEVQNSLKELFSIANQYKVAYFVKEDIDNIGKNEAFDNREGNRKVKNIWHRVITEWQIKKRCTMFGIQLIDVISCYTSFIGNIMYDYFDATNAAIEICRKGMFKFEKGLFYPQITGTISDTMSKFFEQQNVQLKPRDAQIFKDCKKWDKLFKIAADNGLRWRWDWDKVEKPCTIFSIGSAKSKVSIVRFPN